MTKKVKIIVYYQLNYLFPYLHNYFYHKNFNVFGYFLVFNIISFMLLEHNFAFIPFETHKKFPFMFPFYVEDFGYDNPSFLSVI